MTLAYELTRQDVDAFRRFEVRRRFGFAEVANCVYYISLVLFVVMTVLALSSEQNAGRWGLPFAACIFIGFFAAVLAPAAYPFRHPDGPRAAMRVIRPRRVLVGRPGPMTIELSATGIEIHGPSATRRWPYSEVDRVHGSHEHYFIELGDYAAMVVPGRAFGTPAEAAQFVAHFPRRRSFFGLVEAVSLTRP